MNCIRLEYFYIILIKDNGNFGAVGQFAIATIPVCFPQDDPHGPLPVGQEIYNNNAIKRLH